MKTWYNITERQSKYQNDWNIFRTRIQYTTERTVFGW